MKFASSSYYCQPLSDPVAQEHEERELRDHIERLQEQFPGYGYRRLSQQVRCEGIVAQRQENPTGPLAEFQDRHHRFKSQPQSLSQPAGR